jgi:hypothetical protein
VKLFYLDEAGDLQGLPAQPTSNDQPTFTLAGIFIDYGRLDSLTQDFLKLKRRFFPGLDYRSSAYLDSVLPEIKGAHLRRGLLHGNRNNRRHTFGFLDHLFDLLETNGALLVARIWIKPLGRALKSTSIYTKSLQRLYEVYDHYLTTEQDYGVCLLDSRTKGLNVPVAHSIFTQKFKTSPKYPRIVELPGFVHSDNHVGIQIADILCSAILTPIAGYSYCSGHISTVHTDPAYLSLKQRYGLRLKALQYRYPDTMGRWRGGITLSDEIASRSAAIMFQ